MQRSLKLSPVLSKDLACHNKYVRPRDRLAYLDGNNSVPCCLPLVSHVKYATRDLLLFERQMGQTDGRTDARTLHYTFR